MVSEAGDDAWTGKKAQHTPPALRCAHSLSRPHSTPLRCCNQDRGATAPGSYSCPQLRRLRLTKIGVRMRGSQADSIQLNPQKSLPSDHSMRVRFATTDKRVLLLGLTVQTAPAASSSRCPWYPEQRARSLGPVGAPCFFKLVDHKRRHPEFSGEQSIALMGDLTLTGDRIVEA